MDIYKYKIIILSLEVKRITALYKVKDKNKLLKHINLGIQTSVQP